MKRWVDRFRWAFRGLRIMFLTEPSGRVHAAALAGVVVAGFALQVSAMEWAVLMLAAGGVLAAEALNTAVERLADRVTRDHDEAIRNVKDLAAGGVLAASLAAAVAGAAILLPKLAARFAE